jgi:prolyl-tRNA synthetase
VIVPCGITVSLSEADKDAVINTCKDVETRLKKSGLRVYGDYRDNYAPGWKFNDWELKGKMKRIWNLLFSEFFLGVPIRVEIGPNDTANSQLTVVLRHTGNKSTIPVDNSETKIREILEQMHKDLYTK